MFSTNERTRTRNNGERKHGLRTPHPRGGLPSPRRQQSRPQLQPQIQTDVKPWGSRTSATLPNPEVRPQGRVRVQAGAGDKCVPPAKSKHKKRTAVPGRPIDTSALSMDAIVWSEETYNVEELIRNHGSSLPLIVKVTQGYTLTSGENMFIDQVFQVHSYDQEERIRATTETHGGKLSLPINYPMQLFMKGDNIQERLSLQSAIAEKELPLRAIVTSVDETIEVGAVSVLGRHLVFFEKHREYFLRANTINDGWIDQQQIEAIPGFLGALFSIGLGMRGASKEEWADYYGMFSRSVRHLNFQLSRGYEGIIIEDNGGGTIQITSPNKPIPVYENMSIDVEERRAFTLNSSRSDQFQVRNSLGRENMTNTDEMTKDHKTSTNTGFDVPTSDLCPPNKNALLFGHNTGTKISQIPETTYPDVDEMEVEELFKSILDVAEPESLKQSEGDRTEPFSVETTNTKMLNNNRESKNQQTEYNTSPCSHASQTKYHQNEKGDMNQSRNYDGQGVNKIPSLLRESDIKLSFQNENITKPAKQTKRQSYRSSSSSRDSTDIEVRSVEAVVHSDPTHNSFSFHVHDNESNMQDLVNTFEVPVEHIGAEVNHMHVTKSNDGHQVVGIGNKSETPKAVVSPIVNQSSIVNISITESNSASSGRLKEKKTRSVLHSSCTQELTHNYRSNIMEIDDVPRDIAGLNVEDVCQCLHLLNMDCHLTEFRKHQIDGNSLSNIREAVLIDKFHFTPFNASKLVRFIRGWRPKFL